jgi:hypothetical protein
VGGGATVGVEVGGGDVLGVGPFVGPFVSLTAAPRAGVSVGSRVRVAVGVGVGRGNIGQAQMLIIWVHRNKLKTRRFIAFYYIPFCQIRQQQEGV